MTKLVENIDYYVDDKGNFVFTAHFLKKRGHCCKNGCRHCPYGFAPNSKRPDNPKPD